MTELEARGDYYVGPDGDPWASPGEWIGSLASELGLDDSVARATLLAVMDGRDPRTGKRVVRVGSTGNHVAAHDLVFSAPSSVTAAWVLADEEGRRAIQKAHDEAVREAFAHVEKYFPLVRRRLVEEETTLVAEFEHTHGRLPTREERWSVIPIVNETAQSLLAAQFAHHTARQTQGQVDGGLPPDPQLHSHVLLMGVAKRHDGKFVAVDSLVLHRGRAEAGAVYRAALAGGLAMLGYEIARRTGNKAQYFEIRGIAHHLRDTWSSRTKEVETRAEEWRRGFEERFGRLPTLAEQREWNAKTRPAKAIWYKRDLFQTWHAQARAAGVTPQAVAAEDARRRTRGSTLPSPAVARAQLIDELLAKDGVTREHATFDLPLLRLEAHRRAPGLVVARDVEEALNDLIGRQEVVEVHPGVWTTREMLALEDRVLAWRQARLHRAPHSAVAVPSMDAWERAMERSSFHLSTEQLSALQQLRDSPGFVALVGEAGVGKGVVLGVAADAWREEGRRVFAVAVGGAQAQRLAADLGEGAIALTLDALTYRVKAGILHLAPTDVIAIDEAGQVDTRRWAALVDVLGDERNPSVVALGDEAQLSSIAAGGLWSQLATGAPRLTEVRRTKIVWEREAWAHLRRGESNEALTLYALNNRLRLAPTRAEALDAAVAMWDEDGRSGLIVTDSSNAERYRANVAAQARRIERCELGDEAVTVSTASGPISLHTGDRIIFKGQYRPVGVARVENGTTGDVIAIDLTGGRRVLVRTHEATRREIVIPLDAYAGLDLNYAAHVSTAQGTTVPRAYVVAGGWQTNRESLYVQVSRSRRGSYLFVDRESLGRDADVHALRELARRSAQSRAKVAATSRKLPQGYRSYLNTPIGKISIPPQLVAGYDWSAYFQRKRASGKSSGSHLDPLVVPPPSTTSFNGDGF